jgi:hypothetical protein
MQAKPQQMQGNHGLPQLEVTNPSGHVERSSQEPYYSQHQQHLEHSNLPMNPDMNLSSFSPHSTAPEPTHPYDAHLPNHTQQSHHHNEQQSLYTNYNSQQQQQQQFRPDFEMGGSRMPPGNTAKDPLSPQSFGMQGPVPGGQQHYPAFHQTQLQSQQMMGFGSEHHGGMQDPQQFASQNQGTYVRTQVDCEGSFEDPLLPHSGIRPHVRTSLASN